MKHIVSIFSNRKFQEREIECPDEYKCGDYEVGFSPIPTCPPGVIPESLDEYKIVYGVIINVTSTKSKEQIIKEVKEKYADIVKNDEPYTVMNDIWDNTKIREVVVYDLHERCPHCGEVTSNDW